MKLEEMGQLHDADALFLRSDVGRAKGEDGREYELSLINGHVPVIRSCTSGRWMVMRWSDIVALARMRGVDDPAQDAEESHEG